MSYMDDKNYCKTLEITLCNGYLVWGLPYASGGGFSTPVHASLGVLESGPLPYLI